jgi:GNAT superfamily N-acetyltransferase
MVGQGWTTLSTVSANGSLRDCDRWQDAAVDITRTDASETVADFILARVPSLDVGLVRNSVDPAAVEDLRMVVGHDDGSLVAVGFSCRPPSMPPERRFVYVATVGDRPGEGFGAALHAELVAALSEEVEGLASAVSDDDEVALAVARHWGYEVLQHSTTSELDLAGARYPEPPTAVTLESCDELVFEDEDDVARMLLASQTNPEAELGILSTLDGWRRSLGSGQRGVAVLARLEGRPAAISFAVADGDEMHVFYTGVDRELRGRDLGRLTKQFLHAHAADLGLRTVITDNESGNAGIRHVNERLGYIPRSGVYFMGRPLRSA